MSFHIRVICMQSKNNGKFSINAEGSYYVIHVALHCHLKRGGFTLNMGITAVTAVAAKSARSRGQGVCEEQQ